MDEQDATPMGKQDTAPMEEQDTPLMEEQDAPRLQEPGVKVIEKEQDKSKSTLELFEEAENILTSLKEANHLTFSSEYGGKTHVPRVERVEVCLVQLGI